MNRILDPDLRSDKPQRGAPDKEQALAPIRLPALVPIAKSKEHFGWSRATSYRLAAAGALRLLKVGAATYVQSESALAYIATLAPMVPKAAHDR